MKNLLYIGNKLAAKGISPTSIDILGGYFKEEGFNIITASSKKNKLLRLSDMLLKVFQNSKTMDFVLIDTYSTQNFWYAYAVAKCCKYLNLDYIPILHGGNLPKRIEKSPSACTFLFGNAYVNVAPSKYLCEAFDKAGYSRTEYIPNTIRIEDYHFLLRKELKPKLLWVRSFAEIYNPILALKTLELLLKDFPEAELCMVGPAKDDSFFKCKNYAEAKQLPVKFTGKLEKPEWLDLAAEYDIFINTTNFDNTPISVMEAMALGLPVISTNVGGIPYLLEDQKDALLVQPNDAEAFVFQIKKLLDNPSLAKDQATNARKKAETFEWDVVKHKWISILT